MKTNQLQKNIPKEWQEKTLGDFLSKLEGGGTPSKDNSDYWNGSIPWASVKDIVTHNSNDTQDHISELGLKNSSSRLVAKGTLIVPTRMALGHAVVFNVDVAINQDLKALYPKKDLLNKYLFYWFLFKKEFIERLGSGSTVSGIQQNELKRIKFNLPSLPEQKHIVSVLEIWDKAIENLNKKIEVKKQIKKGLMQDLLTGKKRLTGFKDKWGEEKLGDLIIKQEKTNRQSGTSLNVGKYPFFNNSSKGFDQYINEFDFDGEMLIANTGGVAYIDYYFGKFAVMSDCFVFTTKQDCKFLFYNLKRLELLINHEGFTGSGIKHLDKKFFFKLKILLPLIKEQNAIAKILTTSDEEITELEKKLSIIKDQKKFLLNNLITGAIRTPENMKIKT